MTQVHYGHVFHVAGRPTVDDAAAALVEIPDGAIAIDDSGRITFCGNRSELPGEYTSAAVHDHRPGFLLPGFVDTHVHFPQTYAGDSYGGGQLLEWLNLCIFPSESRFADPEFAARGGRRVLRPPDRRGHHRGDGLRIGVPARAGRAVHRDAAPRPARRQRPRHPDRRTRDRRSR